MEGKIYLSLLKRHHRGGIAIIAFIFVCLFIVIMAAGVTWAFAANEGKKKDGEQPSTNGSGFYDGSNFNKCYMPDEFWTSASNQEIPDANAVLEKLSKRSIKPTENDIDLLLAETRRAGVNPAVAIATWGKEQNFDKRNFAFGAGSSDSFGQQLSKHIKTLTDARDNKGYYNDRPSDVPIQVWWIDIYTPASDERNDISSDRGIFFTFLKMLVPNQIVCPTLASLTDDELLDALDKKFDPPFGDRTKMVNSSRKKPHSPAGIFGFDGFSKASGDGAIDFSGVGDIYAAFNGTISKATDNHISGTGGNRLSGGILWLKSNDGNNGAVYAHIEFAPGVGLNSTVKQGQKIATVAQSCSKSRSKQCTNLGPHLHFEFYLNKKGLNTTEMRKLFDLR